jgi:hypothetical protein
MLHLLWEVLRMFSSELAESGYDKAPARKDYFMGMHALINGALQLLHNDGSEEIRKLATFMKEGQDARARVKLALKEVVYKQLVFVMECEHSSLVAFDFNTSIRITQDEHIARAAAVTELKDMYDWKCIGIALLGETGQVDPEAVEVAMDTPMHSGEEAASVWKCMSVLSGIFSECTLGKTAKEKIIAFIGSELVAPGHPWPSTLYAFDRLLEVAKASRFEEHACVNECEVFKPRAATQAQYLSVSEQMCNTCGESRFVKGRIGVLGTHVLAPQNRFWLLPALESLKSLYQSDPVFSQGVHDRDGTDEELQQADDDCVSLGIWSGTIAKRAVARDTDNVLADRRNLGLIIGIDGLRVWKGKQYSITPSFISVASLPAQLRVVKRYLKLWLMLGGHQKVSNHSDVSRCIPMYPDVCQIMMRIHRF